MTPRRRRVHEQSGRVRVRRQKALRRRLRSATARVAAVALVTSLGVLGSAPAGATAPAACGPQTGSSSPRAFVGSRKATFFSASDGPHGRELWKTDGTRAGTVLVKDIHAGTHGSDPSALRVVGDTLFFTADDGVHGRELWRSDGTRAGTVLVKDVRPGVRDSNPAALTSIGRTLFFDADDGAHGSELWKTDGTRTGTVLVKDIRPGARGSHHAGSSETRRMTQASGTLFFEADDGTHGDELWRSDGTARGTVLVRDIDPGPADGLQLFGERNMLAVGPALFFSATDGTHGIQLWETTGTSAGTVSLTEFTQDYYYGNVPTQLTDVDGTLFFTAMELGGHGNEGADDLWKSDGTKAGTVLVEPMDGYAYPSNLTAVGDTLFFESFDFVRGAELWKSDGTTAGTTMVKDIAPGPEYPSGNSFPNHLSEMGGRVYFAADDHVHGRELWRSDGTQAGTVLVKDVRPGPGESDPSSLAAVGRTLFFSADDGTHGAELWESDGTRAGTVLVRDIDPTPPCAGTSPAAPDPARSGPGPARAAPARPQLG